MMPNHPNPKSPFRFPSIETAKSSRDEMDSLWRALAQYEQHLEDNPCTCQCCRHRPDLQLDSPVSAREIVAQIDAQGEKPAI